MRKRKRFRKATAMVCLVSLAAGFSGCGEKEEKKTMRVITDQRLYDKVDMAGAGDGNREASYRDHGRKGAGCLSVRE